MDAVGVEPSCSNEGPAGEACTRCHSLCREHATCLAENASVGSGISCQEKGGSVGFGISSQEKKSVSLNGGDGLAVNSSIDLCNYSLQEKKNSGFVKSLSEEVGRDCRVPFQEKKSVSCVCRGSKCFDCSLISKIPCSQRPINLPCHVRELYERSVSGLTTQEAEQLMALLLDFSDVFSEGAHDLGRTDLVKHGINTAGAAPIRQPARRLPLAKREEATNAIAEMSKQGVIEPSASPWSSPVVFVKKKDGSLQFCIDYRKLNDVTVKDSYPLPRIDDSVEALAGASWFSTLDLKSGYWQVELDDQAKEKTAFSIGTGLWQFTVMPFGLSNAPATFERLMEQVLAGLPLNTALIYLDDVLVAGRTFAEHIANLRVVFQRFRRASLKLNPKKCFLLQKQVKYLDHVVSESGIATDPEKVEAVRSWATPQVLKVYIVLLVYVPTTAGSFQDFLTLRILSSSVPRSHSLGQPRQMRLSKG